VELNTSVFGELIKDRRKSHPFFWYKYGLFLSDAVELQLKEEGQRNHKRTIAYTFIGAILGAIVCAILTAILTKP